MSKTKELDDMKYFEIKELNKGVIGAIKRKAKKLRLKLGKTHIECLDLIAKENGFIDWNAVLEKYKNDVIGNE